MTEKAKLELVDSPPDSVFDDIEALRKTATIKVPTSQRRSLNTDHRRRMRTGRPRASAGAIRPMGPLTSIPHTMASEQPIKCFQRPCC